MIFFKMIFSILTVISNIIAAFTLRLIFKEDSYSGLCFLSLIVSHLYNVYESRSVIEGKKKLII
jgi:hypothetical protein